MTALKEELALTKAEQERLHQECTIEIEQEATAGNENATPLISELIIQGSEFHGSLLAAKGSLKHCTRCRFQWYVSGHLNTPEHDVFTPIEGANTPQLLTNADDAGKRIQVLLTYIRCNDFFAHCEEDKLGMSLY